MTVSIVCAYYNRKFLFKRTLESIKQQKSQTSINLEVIAVDDGSDEDERLEDLVAEFPFLKIIRLEKQDKWYFNSCIPFNIGFREAKGDIVIIQNPECMHFGNVLEYATQNTHQNNYISFSCFSLGIENTDNLENLLKDIPHLKHLMQENKLGYIGDGLDCWYNHPEINPTGYHFCTAITRENLYDLGGFDERFARGIAWDDNEFLHRIKTKGLQVSIVNEPLVLHQNHYKKITYSTDKNILDEETYQKRLQLAEKNRILFEEVTKSGKPWKVNHFEQKQPKENLFKKIFKSFRK